MAPLDVTSELADLSADEPTGPNLELDAAFGALERSAQGKPEKQYGNTIIPAEEPDWKEVAANAGELIERTHDLRVLSHLAVARLHLSGLPAFVEALSQTRALLEHRWDFVHPRLDPEDDNDPTLRANALLRLCEPIYVIRFLRLMPLASSAKGGPFSWRDIALATGAIENDGGQAVPSEASIRGVFADADPARMTVLREAAALGVREAAAIPKVFDAQAGGAGPDFDELVKLLREIERAFARYAPAAAPSDEPAVDEAAAADVGAGQAGSRATRNAFGAADVLSIDTRADAMRMLDLVRQYFERNEPSSPLPLLLDRSRKLADMGFLEILRDLAPDGLMQAQIVVQPRDG